MYTARNKCEHTRLTYTENASSYVQLHCISPWFILRQPVPFSDCLTHWYEEMILFLNSMQWIRTRWNILNFTYPISLLFRMQVWVFGHGLTVFWVHTCVTPAGIKPTMLSLLLLSSTGPETIKISYIIQDQALSWGITLCLLTLWLSLTISGFIGLS